MTKPRFRVETQRLWKDVCTVETWDDGSSALGLFPEIRAWFGEHCGVQHVDWDWSVETVSGRLRFVVYLDCAVKAVLCKMVWD